MTIPSGRVRSGPRKRAAARRLRPLPRMRLRHLLSAISATAPARRRPRRKSSPIAAETPMLSSGSAKAVTDSIAFYEGIVAAGGWPALGTTSLKPGSKGENVAALIRRLEIEGYLPADAVQGEAIYTRCCCLRRRALPGEARTGRDGTSRQADCHRAEHFSLPPGGNVAGQPAAHRAVFEGPRATATSL